MDKFVSIILPVRNEERYIDGCLRSIIAQDYPHDLMEILVIDGQSSDGTVDKINEFKAESSKFKEGPDSSVSRAGKQTQNDGVGIRVIDNPDRTVPYAMNLGITNAKGDIILRFDGHAVMEPDYVSNCVKYIEQTKADNVGGPAQNITDGTITGQSIAMSHNSAFGLGGGAFRMGNYEGFTDTVTFGCFPKETFAKYGLYDTRLTRNQDIELNARIRKGLRLNSEFRILNSEYGPGKIYLTPKIKSYYYCRNTLRGLWSQNFRNGQWVVYTKYIAPYSLSLRHFIPLIFVAFLIMLVTLAAVYHPQTPVGAQLLSGVKKAMGMRTSIYAGLFDLGRWDLRLGALRLLMLELVAYFLAMLLFVVKAGQTKFTVYNLKFKGTKKNIEDGIQNIDKNENSKFDIQNSRFSFGSLALLPLVFMTLHFSYGLGSIWGLITLPYYSLKFKAES